MAKNLELFIINEITVWKFFRLAIFGRKPVIISIIPLIPRLAPILGGILEKLVQAGRAQWFSDLCPEIAHAKESDFFGARSDIFARTEEWLKKHFNFGEVKEKSPDYEMPIKFVCCKTSMQSYNFVVIIKELVDRLGVGFNINGADDHDIGLFRALHGVPMQATSHTFARTFVNTILTILFGIAFTRWIVFHTRINPPQPQTVLLGSDFIGDDRDVTVWREIADDDRNVLIMLRGKEQIPEIRQIAPGFRFALPDAGRFGLRQAVAAWTMAWTHTGQLWRNFRVLPTRFFYPIIALPFRRIRFQALFGCYRFQWFWGRDDYNVDHMIRNQELRRIGGLSMGVNHGLPVVCPVPASWRYLDFDRYFVFGRHLHQKYLADTWPAEMKVIPIGSFAMTRERLARLGNSKPRDVVFFASPDPDRLRAVAEVFRMATLMPDRRVFIKLKPGKEAVMADVANLCRNQAPPNVCLTAKNSYDLLFECRYVFAITTTMVAEAIQFGCVSFALDIYGDALRQFYYRDFPHLCVTSAEQAVRRIRAIESGGWTYPRETFGDLIDLSGRSCYDIIRESLDLPPRSPDRCLTSLG